MKKITCSFILLGLGIISFAQKIEDVSKLMEKKQYKEAKASIDKMLTDPKNAADEDVWYYKGRVYNAYSYDSSLSKAERVALKTEALEAFKKNQEIDKKDIRMKLENHISYLDIYGGFYDMGAQQFNAKDYAAAYESFKKANDTKDFILGRKYEYTEAKLNALDTALVLNMAVAAAQAKNDEASIANYTKLIDAGIAGKDYEEVYVVVADHYVRKKDSVNLQKIMEKGKRLYPKNGYWAELELQQLTNAGDKTAIRAKYDALLAEDPTNFPVAYNYAVDLYNELYGNNKTVKPENEEAARTKLTQTIEKAIAADKGIDATVLMANHLFNVGADYSSAQAMVKGTKPEDVKKKADLKAKTVKAMDECLPYALKAETYYAAQPNLKASEKANYQNVLGYLGDIYNIKGDAKKAAEYDKKKAAIKF
ncbi:MAG: hypothetical protein EOO20_19000 [Chryseobacterium sp.]|nr:MAG: hypothetical protein EOO20_19000 [Chryseobacterium sp.]